MAEIEALIREAEIWRTRYHASGNQIEAAASAIRIKALKDALSALKGRRELE